MIQCTKCHATFSDDARVASISGGIMGDEYIESYYLCPQCQVYTMELWHDRFLGEDSFKLYGPISKQDGDQKVGLIRRCERPWDKKCRCEAHREYFGENLD